MTSKASHIWKLLFCSHVYYLFNLANASVLNLGLVNTVIIVWNMSSLKHSDMEKKAKVNWACGKSVISENRF